MGSLHIWKCLFCPDAWLTWYTCTDSKPRFPQNFKGFGPLSSEIQNVCQVWWQLESLSFLGNLIWTLIALRIFFISSEVWNSTEICLAICLLHSFQNLVCPYEDLCLSLDLGSFFVLFFPLLSVLSFWDFY